MSEKEPAKRGILASLLGLFGEEDELEDQSRPGTGFEIHEEPRAERQPGPATAEPVPPAPPSPEPAPFRAPVVRESYEPGWYAVSASQWDNGGEDTDAPAAPTPRHPAPVPPPEPAPSFGPGDAYVQEDPLARMVGERAEQENEFGYEYGYEPEPEPEPEPPAEAPSIEPVVVPEPPSLHVEAQQPGPDAPPFQAAWDEAAGFATPREEPSEAEPVAEVAEAPQAEPEPEPFVAPVPEPEPFVAAEPEPFVAAEPEPFVAAEPEPFVAAEPEPDFEPAPDLEPAPFVASEPDEVPAFTETPVMAAYEPPPAGLFSRAAAERRETLARIVERGVNDEDVDGLLRLLQDPERDIRRGAIEALAQRADHVGAAAVRQALLDPTDDVRAAAVRLAGARSASDVPEVLPLVASRHWPLAQQAALDVIPGLVARAGLTEPDLEALLAAIGHLDSQPVEAERGGFAALAEAIGRDHLIAALETGGATALGAGRLLVEEGSDQSLRAVAARTAEPDEEMRNLAQGAADLLGEEPEMEEETLVEEEPAREAVEQEEAPYDAPQSEMLAGLARALHDPDDMVRRRARDALAGLDRGTLSGWVRDSLRGRDDERAALAAEVAGVAALTEAAPEVLVRATAFEPEARG